MRIMIHDPQHPKDRSKAVALSSEQFAIVHDYIIGCMNAGKRINEKVILRSLEDAGLPMQFGLETQ